MSYLRTRRRQVVDWMIVVYGFLILTYAALAELDGALTVEQLCQLAEAHGNGMPANLVVAQIYEESGGQPYIRSDAGALGLMQIIERFHPDTDLADPSTNVDLGTHIMVQDYFYLNHIRGKFKDVSEIDWTETEYVRRALWGYVMGPGNVVWYDQNPEKTMPHQVVQYAVNILKLADEEDYCAA